MGLSTTDEAKIAWELANQISVVHETLAALHVDKVC